MGTTLFFYDLITQFHDELQRLQGGISVIFLLGFGKLAVRDEAGVLLLFVIAAGTVGPAVIHAGLGPHLVRVFGKLFAQLHNVIGKDDVIGVDWVGGIWFHISAPLYIDCIYVFQYSIF